MSYIKKTTIMNQLSQFAKERVEIVAQDTETKKYYINLKEGYVFKGRFFQGEIRGYGGIVCDTVQQVKKNLQKRSIQEGICFKKGDEKLEKEYRQIIEKENASMTKTLEKATNYLESEEGQNYVKETFKEAIEKSKEKMASQEWQEEIEKKAWNSVLKELNATIQYAGKEETYKRYFGGVKDEDFEKKSLQAQEILHEQKRAGRNLIDWIIPYVFNSKDGFLVQMKKGLKNPVFIQNADELRVTLENLALC